MVLPNPRAYAFIAVKTGSLKVFQNCFNVKALCGMMHRCFLLLCLVATVAGLCTGLPITGVQKRCGKIRVARPVTALCVVSASPT